MPGPFFRFQVYRGAGWPFVVGGIFRIAFLVLIIVGIVWLVRRWGHGHPHLHPHSHSHEFGTPPSVPSTPAVPEDAALREARLRYARGEITRKQYAQIAADLGGTPPGPPPSGEGEQ
jgi:uncharacterized membrane protein